MKRYGILTICLAVLLVSCNKEDAGTSQFTGDGISYSTKVISFADDFVMATKAYTENTAEQVRDNGFTAACIASDGTLIFNEKVDYDQTVSSYRTATPYFYPSSGTVDFSCAFPASNSVAVNSGMATLSHSQDPDTDLLVARRAGIGASDTSVVISFDHALSLIHFKAEGSDDALTYTVKSVSIAVPNGGVFSYSDYAWTAATDSTSEVFSSEAVTLDGLTEIPGAVVFIPCEPKVSVQWDVYDGEDLIESRSETKYLGSILKMGEECTVTLNLPGTDAEEVTFDVVVTPWKPTEHMLNF